MINTPVTGMSFLFPPPLGSTHKSVSVGVSGACHSRIILGMSQALNDKDGGRIGGKKRREGMRRRGEMMALCEKIYAREREKG